MKQPWFLFAPVLTALALGCGSSPTAADDDDLGVDAGSDPSGDAGPSVDAGGEDQSCDWEQEFADFFATDHVVAIDIVFDDPTAWDQMLANKMAREYFPATVTIDGESMTQVGIRFKGNSSLAASQPGQTKSLKVNFEYYVDGQRFHCVDKVNLNNAFKDPSMMREALGYRLANDFGVVAPRTAFAEVTVDGDLHGVFTMVQQVDHRFLKERYGTDNDADDGNLYKLYSDYDFGYLGASATPADYGDSVAETGLVLKTNEDDPTMNSYADVTALAKAIADVLADPGAGNRAALEAVFDIDSYLRYQAWTLVVSNLDAYYGMLHNLYVYDNPVTGKFETLPWDVNEAFGAFGCHIGPPGSSTGDEDVYTTDLMQPCQAVRPLNRLSFQVPEYRARYCEILHQLVDVENVAQSGLYNVADMDQAIADLHQLIGPARQRMDSEGLLDQPPGNYTYADYLANQGHAVPTASGPGMEAGPNLGYFDDQRLANLADLIGAVCQ